MRRVSAAALLATTICLVAALPLAAQERCGTCHPESKVAFAGSIHDREGVSCSSCHGGNPSSLEVEPAHRGNFRPLTNRRDGPAACAECHADLDKMRAYNLPVDQYALYQTSEHGRALARGDQRAAICTDCHGPHRILPSSDAASPTHPRRIAATCDHCHGDPELAAGYGMSSQVVKEYRSSIHGQTLLTGDSSAAPNCTSCHGVHGAGPPGIGALDKICGSCHTQARRAFIEGPHHDALSEAGLAECGACHSHHAIVRHGSTQIAANCTECHDEASDEANLGRLLETSISTAAAEVARAEQLIEKGARMALEVDDHLARLEEARSYLTEVLPVVHAVSRDPVESLTRRARAIGEEVQHEIYEHMDRRPQRLGLALLWFYVVMTVAILVSYKRRLLGADESR